MKTYEEMRRDDEVRDLKRELRGSEYKYSARRLMFHIGCENVEISGLNPGRYTCHNHMTCGID